MAEGAWDVLELQPGADLEALELDDVEEAEDEEAFVITEQLDEETQSLAAGLASRQSGELVHALQAMLKVLATPKRGARVLRQYVLASPKCSELIAAWELGVGAPTAVPLMLLLAELLRHPRGKGASKFSDRQKAKVLVIVQGRLDKLARTICRSKLKDIYSHLSSKQRSRQKAALKLLSSVVLRGKLLAVDVATCFDFTLEGLKKLAQHPFKAPASSKKDGLLHQSTRFFFIEFALSFLVVGDPGLLRWILQKRPLYAGVLHGLAKDGEPTIVQVLRVFQEKVMAPTALVPAGLQSVLFGDVALEQLARIAGDELSGESADLAYETLMALSTDPSHGLCPEYASPWESVNVKAGAHGGNQGRLLRLLLRLRVTEASRHRELLLTTARIRPRLAAAYLDAVPYSLEPRPSSTWFTVMSLLADLIHISSAPPPFASMALRGLPIPAPDGSLVRNNLRHLLPRALTKVALNRGLQHANVLVKHGSLRVLLESLLSLELLLDGAYAAAESICLQEKAGSSESAWRVGDSCWTVVTQKSTNRDESLRVDELESKRLQWLGLVESIQDIMRATLPDPNILLLINSTINSKSGSLKESEGSLKRRQPVVETGHSKRRKKDEGYAVDEDDGAHMTDFNSNIESEVDEQEDNSNVLDTLAQLWGSEAIASAEGLSEPLLHAKVLEVLAAYQRVLPVAFADKGFDPFKLLPSDPLQLSVAQQTAFLSLLLATTGAPRNVSQSNRATYRLAEAGGSGTIYKHVKPLLKLMMGSTVDHIKDSTHLLASRILVSTGAFESNTWESTLWLDHLFRIEGKAMNRKCNPEDSLGDNLNQHLLGSIGECVVGFLAEAVGSVGRTLYKYFDQLFSLLSAHSLGEESSGYCKDLPGSMVPEFGPFVVCALEHALRVVRSESKSLTLPQRSAIVLYVAGVVNDLLRMQTVPRALGIVVTSLLSSESLLVTGNPDKVTSTLGVEWTSLQALYMQAHLLLSGDFFAPSSAMQMATLKMSESSGQLSDVITTCRDASEGDRLRLREDLVSAMVCAPLQEVSNNFFQVVEVISKICGRNTPILITLCGLHCKLLTAVDFAVQTLKKSKDQAMGRQLLVADLLSSLSCNSNNLIVSAMSGCSSSLRKQAECVYYFLRSLPFSVLFSAIIHGTEGEALSFELLSAALNNSYSTISVRDQLAVMQMILNCIQKLAFSTLECLDKKRRLGICFTYLKRLVIPENLNLEGGQDTVSKEILLCKDMVTKSLTHRAISEFCMCPTAMEATSAQHQEGARLLDEYIMAYLKFLLTTSSAIDLHGMSEYAAELFGSLQEITFQACKPLVQQAMKLFLLKWQGKVPGEDETTFSRDFQLIQSFVIELAGYSDPKRFVFFLSDLMSCKSWRTPSGVSPSSVFLRLVQLFYDKWSQIEQRNGCNDKSSAPLLQETIVGVYRYVVNEVLKDATEDGDRCLLSALQISTSASEVGWSSTSSEFSLLVRVTPIDVINYCVRHPTVVRGSIARILVQTSTTHRNEFGRLLCMGTGEEMSEKGDFSLKMVSRLLGEAKSRAERESLSLSYDDLLLLMPAAKVFLCNYYSKSTTRVVVHVASTYLKLLTTHIKRWDEFVLQLVNLNLLGFAAPKMPCEHRRVEELSGAYFNDLLVLMRRSLALCPSSSKKRVSLLLKLLPKIGLPFVDLQIGCFKGTEAEVSVLFFQLYGKAAFARQILSDIEAQVPEEFNAAMSISKQQKLRNLMAETVTRFATGLASTSTLIFKVTAEVKKHLPSLCIPWTFNVLGALEEYLQLQLVEVVASMDTTGVEADVISLFECYAETCLRYRFGKVEEMNVLRALAMRLANLSDDFTAKRKDIASSVLELVVSHSQFVPYILSCGTTSRPLPMNLERQAGKGTLLSSLPSILSLMGSPIIASGEQTSDGTSDMESTSISGVQDLHMDNGIDALAGISEESQLALLELVRSLFLLKMYPDVGMLSAEDRTTMEELLSLLLAAYGATTNNVDSEIYALMCELESYGGSGSPGLAGMDYLWGEAALKRRKAKVEKYLPIDENMDTDENITEARKRTFKEDLTLDPRRCGVSILCFSTLAQYAISLGIPDLGAKSKKVSQGVAYNAEEHHLRAAAYDPRFILRFALHVLSEGCIGTEEFVCLGLLGLAITSLSSSEEGMRKFGYKILAKYLASLEEGSTFKGQPQIRMLLIYVKNAVTEEWQQLPFVLMLFAAESSCILMHPENPHFMIVTRYLLKGPAMDLKYIPLFHSMFGSGSPRYRSERLWMLRLLACGLASSRDSRVFGRQFVLEILMSFYSSPLADSFTRKWVLQVLMKASRVRGCVQALVERSGFLPWLGASAVSYTDLSISEQDKKEASDLPIMVLEIMERLLRWKFMEQRCLGEGMAELTAAALSLRYFLTHYTTTPKQRAVFRRPTIRIMTYLLRISQRRKKYETHFSLSLHDVLETIHWVESEGPDNGYGIETTGETRALALHMFLQSTPPAASSPEDKQDLSKIASWAVPVAIRGLVAAEKKASSGGGHPEPRKNSEGLAEKLTRWLTASLVLGKLASARNKLGLTKSHADTHPTCLSVLYGSQSIQCADYHPVNKELATRLLQLQIHFSGKDSNPLVTALASLWPFHNEGVLAGDELVGIATSLIERILSNISAPQEADYLWRWSFNNAWRKKEITASGNVYSQISSFEGEISQIALIVLQQLVLEHNPSGLALLISQWAKELDFPSSIDKVCLKDFIEQFDHRIEELQNTRR